MTAEEYQIGLRILYNAALLVAQYDLDGMLSAITRADTLGPILDPTSYRDHHKAMYEDRDLVNACLPLARIGKKLLEKAS